MEFYTKWFAGPSNVCRGWIREMGICRGRMRECRFMRFPVTLEGFVLHLEEVAKSFRETNLFLSIAYYETVELEVRQDLARYIWIDYDVDFEEDPQKAKSIALEIARGIKRRYGCTPVLFFSGLKGAHIIIPLKHPVKWDEYVQLYRRLIAPYKYARELIDDNMLQWNRLSRIPYTFNYKKEGGGFSYIFDLNGKRLRAEDFDWDNYEPLDPDKVEIIRIRPSIEIPKAPTIHIYRTSRSKPSLPENPEDLVSCEAVPPCIRNIIEALIKTGDLDHY